MKKYLGIISVICAGILWGIISIFVRILSAKGLDSLNIAFTRTGLAALMMLVFILIKDLKLLKVKVKDLWMFAGSGILSLTFFSFCYFTNIVESGAAVSVVLLYTSPVFVVLMSAFAFKEKITLKKAVCLVITLLGCVFVTGLIGSGATLGTRGILLGLGSGIFYALYSIFGTVASKKYSSYTITFYTLAFSSLGFMLFTNPVQSFSLVTADMLPALLGEALLNTVLPYIFYTYGLSRMEAGKAAVLVTVEPLVGCLLGIFAWHEPATFLKVVGILLIFSSIILLNLPERSVQHD